MGTTFADSVVVVVVGVVLMVVGVVWVDVLWVVDVVSGGRARHW